MKNKLRIIAAILAAVALISSVSCTGSDPVDPPDVTTTSQGGENDVTNPVSSDNTGADTTESLDPGFEPVDLNGRKFNILTQAAEQFEAELMIGSPVNDAVYQRNENISNKYNMDFVVLTCKAAEFQNKVKVLDKDAEGYDLLTPAISYAMQLAVLGYLIELNEISNINTDKSYWWANVLEDTSVGGKNFFAVSDLNSASFTQMALVFFNKKIAREHTDFGSLYDIVDEGKWTFDKFCELSSAVYADNGDGVVGVGDTFGTTGNSYMTDCFIYGWNMLLCPKDNDDIPYLNIIGNETFADAFEKLRGLFNAESTLFGERQTDRQKVPQAEFSSGKVLFWVESMGWIETLRDSDIDLGLLPIPKLNEAQEKHTNCLHSWSSSSSCVPTAMYDDIDTIGMIIEDMAYESNRLIRPAYYDIYLEGQMARDEESADMIPLIIDNCRIDIAMVYRVPGLSLIDDLRSIASSTSIKLSSQLSKKKSSYENIIKECNEKILASK